jgi:hypothetical protein
MQELKHMASNPLAPAKGRQRAVVDLRSYREACAILVGEAHAVAAEREAWLGAVSLFVLSKEERAEAIRLIEQEGIAKDLPLVRELLAKLDQAARDWPDGWPKRLRPAAPKPLAPVAAG